MHSIEWHQGELFPRVGFLVTSFRLISKEVVKTYNGRTDMENRIKEGKNTLRRDWASYHRFEANRVRLKMGILVYSLLQILLEFYYEERRSKTIHRMDHTPDGLGRVPDFLPQPLLVGACGLGFSFESSLSGSTWSG